MGAPARKRKRPPRRQGPSFGCRSREPDYSRNPGGRPTSPHPASLVIWAAGCRAAYRPRSTSPTRATSGPRGEGAFHRGAWPDRPKPSPPWTAPSASSPPKMAEAGRHPNIRLMSLTEVTEGLRGTRQLHRHGAPQGALRHGRVHLLAGSARRCARITGRTTFDVGLAPGARSTSLRAGGSSSLPDRHESLSEQERRQGVREMPRRLREKGIDFGDSDRRRPSRSGRSSVATGVDVFDASEVPQYQYGRAPKRHHEPRVRAHDQRGGPTGGHLSARRITVVRRRSPSSVRGSRRARRTPTAPASAA